MSRFKKILVYAGLDGANDPALMRAASVAKANSATVELVDVVEGLPAYVRLAMPSELDVEAIVLADRKSNLEHSVQWLREEGVEADFEVLHDRPEIAITQHVLRGKHDLVMKTARPDGTTRWLKYGTLAKRLMRVCPCPVWIIQPEQPYQCKRIAAAINPDDDDAKTVSLNRSILDMASSLSKPDGSELHVLHAWNAQGETLLRNRMAAEKMKQYVAHCEAAAKRQLDKFLAEYGELPAGSRAHRLQGDADDAISEFVEDNQIDLVVMGTICRTGIAGYVIGNTAEKLLRRIGSSVLAIKPDGFQSPIMLE